jgi:DNA-binding IclR family transcriptional regulator/sugar lactone lactonase YvrE
MPATASSSTEGTAALDKALDVLDAVGRAPTGLSQAELAQQLALPRTTLYRLLGTLVARGLLRRDPLRRVYGLGMRCFEYARAAYAMPDLVAAAGAELRALRDMTGETAYLAARDGLEVVALERCDGAHSQRSASAPGQRKPLHCTSQGKAILAALPAAEREALVRELPMTAVTPHSITDRRRLLAELRVTAARGWSVDDEEIVPGVRCCGAAIVDAAGQVRGSISIAGPAFRLSSERVELLGPEVAEAARRIGAQLSAVQVPRAEGEATAVPGHWAFEGAFPLWHAGQGALIWADALGPALHRATATADTLLADADAPIDALLADGDGVLARWGGRWHRVDATGQAQTLTAPPFAFDTTHATTWCTDAGGTAWACTPDGGRWRVAPADASLAGWLLPEPATALAWDATSEVLHIAAAGSGTLWTVRRGSPGVRRLATVPKGSGRLAGLAVDREGGVWTGLRGGWGVVRLEPDGTLERLVALPVPCPSGLAFGGSDGRTLFVTTARDAVSREALEAAPLSGRLFTLRTEPDATG